MSMVVFLWGFTLGCAFGWLVAGRFPARAQQHFHRLEAWWIRWKIRKRGL